MTWPSLSLKWASLSAPLAVASASGGSSVETLFQLQKEV